MIHADAEMIHRVLDYRSLIEALRQAHREGSKPQVHTEVVQEPDGENTFVSLLAWAPRDVIAV
jgi:hypothetical protein